jgi:hypothetical protein
MRSPRYYVQGRRQQYRNWLSTRYHARGNGKAPLPDRVTRSVASRTPVCRNQVNPATGRPRWTDRNPGAVARWQAERIQERTREAENHRRTGRSR